MKSGKLLYYNWNRMSMLIEKRNLAELSEIESLELTMRISFQNNFANSTSDTEKEKVISYIEETLSKDIIKAVDIHMKKAEKNR